MATYIFKTEDQILCGLSLCITNGRDKVISVPLLFLQACRDVGVQCIVAPYEADSQLAYMLMSGLVQLVISEDSDLLVFGTDRVCQ